jgi:hypothetical protein
VIKSLPDRGETRADASLGAAAVALIKAGAEIDKKDSDGYLALDLAPDKEVSLVSTLRPTVFL